MSRRLIFLAVLVPILPAAGCSTEAAPAMSAKFRTAIRRADQAVHGDLSTQGQLGQAAFDAAVTAARAALQAAAAEAQTPAEENAYLVLLNCFVKDRQRYQMKWMMREGMPYEYGDDQIAGLSRTHDQCSAEFRQWTGPSASDGQTYGGACLVEARKVKAFLIAK